MTVSFKVIGSSGLATTAGRVAFHKRSFKEYLHPKKTLEHHLYFQHLEATDWLDGTKDKLYAELKQKEPKFCDQLTAYFKQLVRDYPERPHAGKHDPRLPAPPPRKPFIPCTKEDVLRSQDKRKAKQASHKAHREANPSPRLIADNSFLKPMTTNKAIPSEAGNEAAKEARWQAITAAQEASKHKASQEAKQRLHLSIKYEYARTSNFGNGDPMKQTKRKLMITYSLSLSELNAILG